MCKRFLRQTVWLGAVLAVLLAASPVGAQEQDGRLHGRVTEAGDPIGGVSVHVEGTDRIATTDSTGGYQLSDLTPG
ncbi:MAG: hypothetical protein ACREK3_11045, partial [Gemmatimonadota bacterium]